MKRIIQLLWILLPVSAFALSDSQLAIDCGKQYKITATPDEGFRFVRWTDGEIANPRIVTAMEDKTFEAVFELNKYAVSFLNYDGTPLQSGEFEYGTLPEYTGATPTKPNDEYSYSFIGWSPEVVAVTGEATYTAQYEVGPCITASGTCGAEGDNLTWVLSCEGVLTISGTGAMANYSYSSNAPWYSSHASITSLVLNEGITSIGDWAFYECTGLTSVSLPNSVTTIGKDAFAACSNLYSVEIQAGVTSIGDGAFSGWDDLTIIKCHAIEPPILSKCVFSKDLYISGPGWPDDELGYEAFLYVPGQSIDAYKTAEGWKDFFFNIQAIPGTEVPTNYTITFVNYDGTPLQSSEVEYGTIPAYTGETPTKPADAQYTYTFSGWDADIVAVTGEATYTAQFSSTLNKYAITFVNYDGTPLQSSEVEYGTIPAYTGETPAKPADEQYTYTFSGWTPDLVAATSEATYTAQFTNTLNKYAITFVNYDGTPLQSGEVEYGTIPSYTGETPAKPADEQYTYSFSGWNPTVVAVTGEATYTAQFTNTLNKYAITFVNYDGTPLQSGEVEYGTIPSYTESTPTKLADEQYTYSFSGWNPTVVAVTGEATYTAQFSSTLNKYAISFVNYDGTPLQSGEVEYGTIPAYTGETPTKPSDEQYTYSFNGWYPELVAVIGEATYTAVFESITVSQDTTFIHDGETPDIGDISGEDPNIVVEPGGELNVNWTDIRIGVITIVSNGSHSGQIHGANNLDGWRIFMEYVLNPLGSTASSNLWYAFAVPFEVDIETGITRAYGKKIHVSGTDFLIMEYDGMQRAQTGKGWKQKLTGTLEPGHFYMIGIEGNCNRWLFEKKSDAAISGDNHMNINSYIAGNSNNGKHNGWNGMGNTQLEYSAMDLSSLGIEYLLTYNSRFDKYEIGLVGEASLCVGQPFFIQTLTDGEFDFVHSSGPNNMPTLYADRQAQNPLMHFTLTDETQSTGIDHMYLTMHEDAVPSYTIGRDVARMSTTCTTAAQLWCTMDDGTQLSAHGIEIPTTSTTVNIELFAPTAGEYLMNMSSRAMEGYEVELLHDGAWIATLYDAQPITIDLNAGTNIGYALRIIRRNMPTDIEGAAPSTSSVNGEKRLIDGVLYILHNGRMYDAKGKHVK